MHQLPTWINSTGRKGGREEVVGAHRRTAEKDPVLFFFFRKFWNNIN